MENDSRFLFRIFQFMKELPSLSLRNNLYPNFHKGGLESSPGLTSDQSPVALLRCKIIVHEMDYNEPIKMSKKVILMEV
jgi:hypothetical protein